MVGPRSGTVAIVTGGARGLGRAFGQALAAEGAHAALVDFDAAPLEAACREIRSSGGSAAAYVGDVTDEPRIAGIMSEIAAAHGGIDVLINNAALHGVDYGRPVGELGVAGTRRLFDVNVMGLVICSLAAQRFMMGRKGANILNIASAAAHVSLNAYGASKLAVAGLTVALARELGPAGVRVNAISPGMIMTDTIRGEISGGEQARLKRTQFIVVDGAEQDVVEAMLFLTSARARFITGETLRVSGGMAAGV